MSTRRISCMLSLIFYIINRSKWRSIGKFYASLESLNFYAFQELQIYFRLFEY